ncbi:UDP-glycosyltransferase UGT41A3 precursor, partial [Danaus plexippus plexippus]
MKTSKRRTDKEREHSKDDILNKKQEERSKKSVYSVSTPRNFVQKSSAADIYARKDAVKAPKKIASNRNNDVSPMKDLLKSSSSSVSQVSTRSYKSKTPVKDVKAIPLSARSAVKSVNAPNRKLPFTNVTVNSPIVKRKLNLEDEGAKVLTKTEIKVAGKRERTNTRTLDEAEIKVLTSDVVDNNTELLKLNQTLSAQPKAFFIDLEDKKIKDKSSDEEVSYEDDFESYESDFDSYHSESNRSSAGDANASDDDDGCDNNVHHESSSREESKLDSGNFDLPERHKDRINPMEYIDEVPESDKKISLTDEGFQDMSSGLSSMKTLHVDILDRPLFIDFTESDANRKRRKIFERLRKRAEDITSMVKFHEISYNLFEMKPIPYELYMASFGRYNYTQTSVQTFDDGVSEEVQTEEVLMCSKWTQHPIEFSNQIIHLNGQDYLNNTTEKFHNKDVMNKVNISDTYINNPLRIYFEQKDGVGNDTVLPYDGYKNKLKKNQYDANKLRKFMKRVESRVCNVLSKNAGNINMSNLVRTSKFPFSTGYMAICTKSLNEESLVKDTEITGVVFSDSKSNLIITIHKKFTVGVLKNKCALCLWDLSVARVEPLKTLMASDDVRIGKFRGSTDGYFVGALEDGSISLWDLSEEAWWSHDANTLADDRVRESNLSQCELDREWNLRNNSNYVKVGNFDLPERHKDRINPMEYIDEVPESDKKISLTDEGFQDMSSGLSSMKTLHVDILDRPLFIDFTESDANRKRRKIFERLRKRAEDITSMVKFHEISYNLFEMKPIPYELYMASFGRYNYTQTSVQTFDDGVSEEVQTEEVLMCSKWTQHPIEFSNQIIHLNGQDYLNNTTEKFHNKDVMNKVNISDTYINNPLRIYFEQKDGVGNDTVLPYDGYKNKLKKNQYDANKLRKFMKRVESRVCNVLSKNAGNINMSNLVRTSKFPFSTGYMAICTKSLNEESLVKDTEITGVVFSDSKSNLIITIHKKFTVGVLKNKCALCLWDLSVARVEPLKTLMASDDVRIGKFRGSTDGYFVGALEDGSISLWDLSEEAWWSHDANTLADDRVRESNLSQCELDREWNLRNNSNYVKLQQQRYVAQVSAFTSSGINVCEDVSVDSIVGLEFTDYTGSVGSDVIGQICSLQRIGVLTIWSIIRERAVKSDIGKALWSKIKLRRSQVIVLSEYLEANRTVGTDFNLNSAKKRIAARKREKNIIKRQHSRPKSSSTFNLDRTDSVAINKTDTNFWENGIICSDLKIIHLKVDNYLVGKNLGEVLCCMKNMGGVKINRFTVASKLLNHGYVLANYETTLLSGGHRYWNHQLVFSHRLQSSTHFGLQ